MKCWEIYLKKQQNMTISKKNVPTNSPPLFLLYMLYFLQGTKDIITINYNKDKRTI